MRIVSFSLWGTDPKYVSGALRNAALAAEIYPGWECRFYCGRSVPGDAVDALSRLPGVRVVKRPEHGDWTAMFWRFLAAAEPDLDAAIFRDTDSRLGHRERAAVDAWLQSGRSAHVMRDHPEHDARMLGGMWGVRGKVLPDMASMIDACAREDRWQIDQEFLRDVIAPLVSSSWLEHDEYFARRPFPTRRRGREFVGQPFDADDRPLIEGPTDRERRVRQFAARVLQSIGLRPRPTASTS